MAEPAVRSCAVPVLYLSRNVDAVAWIHLNCRLALLLIVSASTDTYKDLSATALCVMDMPVVTATRLKCHVEHSDLTSRYWKEIAVSYEILGKCIIWLSDREYHALYMCSHGLILIWKIALIYIPHFLCKIEYCPSLWPAGVEANMCDDRCDLLL